MPLYGGSSGGGLNTAQVNALIISALAAGPYATTGFTDGAYLHQGEPLYLPMSPDEPSDGSLDNNELVAWIDSDMQRLFFKGRASDGNLFRGQYLVAPI